MDGYRIMYCPRGDWRYWGNAQGVAMVNECPVCQGRLVFLEASDPDETGADVEAAYAKLLKEQN